MVSIFELVEYCAVSAMFVLMLMALGIAVTMPALDRWSKRFFIVSLSLLMLCVIVCLIDEIIYRNPNFIKQNRI